MLVTGLLLCGCSQSEENNGKTTGVSAASSADVTGAVSSVVPESAGSEAATTAVSAAASSAGIPEGAVLKENVTCYKDDNYLETRIYYFNEHHDCLSRRGLDKETGEETGQSDYRYEYDEKGNLVFSTRLGNTLKKTVYRYDDDGNNIETLDYDNGKLSGRTFYRYDKTGYQYDYKYISCRDGEDTADSETKDNVKAEFDKDGRVIRVQEFDSKEAVILTRTFEYDNNGKLIREEAKYQNGKTVLNLYEYDQNGNQVRSETVRRTASEEKRIAEMWEYDENNRMLRYIRENNNGSIERYEYEYVSLT